MKNNEIKQNTEIVENNENETINEALARLIKECFMTLKDKDLLIMNRRVTPNFFWSFADSLYSYERGIVLIERFYKKEKCITSNNKIEEFTDDDKKIIQDFHKFTESIPDVAKLSEEEIKDYENKISEYQEKIKNIKPSKIIVENYMYAKSPLIEIATMTEEDFDLFAKLYSSLGVMILSSFTWTTLENIGYAVSTIEFDDFVDVILIPIKAEVRRMESIKEEKE